LTYVEYINQGLTCIGGSNAPMFLWISLGLILLGTWYISRRRLSSGTTTTKLRGPPASSFFFGQKELLKIPEASLYTNWAREYGSAYELTSALGSKRVVLFDHKAVAHVGALDTTIYQNHGLTRSLVEIMVRYNVVCLQGVANHLLYQFGRGLSWAEGDDHKRLVYSSVFYAGRNNPLMSILKAEEDASTCIQLYRY
jgi:hypothetical protein